MIHVIGDSHVCFFNGMDGITDMYPYIHNSPPFKTYRLGALLAYNLEKYDLGPFLSGIPEADSILFSLGEIDCRYHIKNQSIKQNATVETIVRNCVDRYITTIIKLNLKHQIGIWGPPATTFLCEKDSNAQCPIKGDHLERNRITKLFNEYLESGTSGTSILFFSIFNDLLLADGTTNPFYYVDSIHLSQSAAPLIAKLKTEMQLKR